MTPTDNEAAARQTRTPPEIKWLLNERAALNWEVDRHDSFSAHLAARLARLTLLHDRTLQLLTASQEMGRHARERIAALDTTMNLLHPQLNPAACGSVQAWAGKYGALGELTRFVLSVLEQTDQAHVPFLSLRDAAVVHFGLILRTRADRESLRSSIRAALGRLKERGLVERSDAPRTSLGATWRVRRNPSIANLRALAGHSEQWFAETADERVPHTDQA